MARGKKWSESLKCLREMGINQMWKKRASFWGSARDISTGVYVLFFLATGFHRVFVLLLVLHHWSASCAVWMCAETDSSCCPTNGHGMHINHSIQIHRLKIENNARLLSVQVKNNDIKCGKIPVQPPFKCAHQLKVGFCGHFQPLSAIIIARALSLTVLASMFCSGKWSPILKCLSFAQISLRTLLQVTQTHNTFSQFKIFSIHRVWTKTRWR